MRHPQHQRQPGHGPGNRKSRPEREKAAKRKTPCADRCREKSDAERISKETVRADACDNHPKKLSPGDRNRTGPEIIQQPERRKDRGLIRGKKRRPAIVIRIPKRQPPGAHFAHRELPAWLDLKHQIGQRLIDLRQILILLRREIVRRLLENLQRQQNLPPAERWADQNNLRQDQTQQHHDSAQQMSPVDMNMDSVARDG